MWPEQQNRGRTTLSEVTATGAILAERHRAFIEHLEMDTAAIGGGRRDAALRGAGCGTDYRAAGPVTLQNHFYRPGSYQ